MLIMRDSTDAKEESWRGSEPLREGAPHSLREHLCKLILKFSSAWGPQLLPDAVCPLGWHGVCGRPHGYTSGTTH